MDHWEDSINDRSFARVPHPFYINIRVTDSKGLKHIGTFRRLVEANEDFRIFQDYITALLVHNALDNRGYELFYRSLEIFDNDNALVGSVLQADDTLEVRLLPTTTTTATDPISLVDVEVRPGNRRHQYNASSFLECLGMGSVLQQHDEDEPAYIQYSPTTSQTQRYRDQLGDQYEQDMRRYNQASTTTSPDNSTGKHRAVHCRGTTSQYSMRGGSSSCTSICLTAACWMLQTGGAVELTSEMLDSFVQQGAQVFPEGGHTDLDDLWSRPVYDTSCLERGTTMSNTISIENLISSFVGALEFAKASNQGPVAVIVTKPPETVLCFANAPDDWYLIDSHGEAYRQEKVVYAMRFCSVHLLAQALMDKFPPIDSMGEDDDNWQMQTINMFEATPLICRERVPAQRDVSSSKDEEPLYDQERHHDAKAVAKLTSARSPSLVLGVGTDEYVSYHAQDESSKTIDSETSYHSCTSVRTGCTSSLPRRTMTTGRDPSPTNRILRESGQEVASTEKPLLAAENISTADRDIHNASILNIQVQLCYPDEYVAYQNASPQMRCSVTCCADLLEPTNHGNCCHCGRLVCQNCLRFSVNDNSVKICLECAAQIIRAKPCDVLTRKHILPRIDEIYNHTKALLSEETKEIAQKKYGPSLRQLADRISSLRAKEDRMDDHRLLDDDGDSIMRISTDRYSIKATDYQAGRDEAEICGKKCHELELELQRLLVFDLSVSSDLYVTHHIDRVNKIRYDLDQARLQFEAAQTQVSAIPNHTGESGSRMMGTKLETLLDELKTELNREPLAKRLSAQSSVGRKVRELREALRVGDEEEHQYESWQEAIISNQFRKQVSLPFGLIYPNQFLMDEASCMLEKLRCSRKFLQESHDAVCIGQRERYAEILNSLQATLRPGKRFDKYEL